MIDTLMSVGGQSGRENPPKGTADLSDHGVEVIRGGRTRPQNMPRRARLLDRS